MDPEARKVIEMGYGGAERLTMNMGPQHPSAHGVFRAILTLQGVEGRMFRPMALTAAAVVVGSAVILFDPIFQGLALAMMCGEIASTTLSRITIPILYFMVESWKEKRQVKIEVEEKIRTIFS